MYHGDLAGMLLREFAVFCQFPCSRISPLVLVLVQDHPVRTTAGLSPVAHLQTPEGTYCARL